MAYAPVTRTVVDTDRRFVFSYNHISDGSNGGTTTTNDASSTGVGSEDSVYQVNTTAGLSIIDYTGTGGNGTIAHGLGVTPNWVIVRNRDGGNSDANFHHFTGLLSADNRVLYGGSNDGEQTNASAFNSTAPTSSVVTVGTNSATNKNDDSVHHDHALINEEINLNERI